MNTNQSRESDRRRDRLSEMTAALLSFDTQNPPGETQTAIEWLRERVARLNVETEWVASDPEKPNLVVTLPGQSDRTLLYAGHLDTVPFDREAWSVDPLGEVRDGRLYGRGATDMKGTVAVMLETLETFATADERPPITLQFAFVSDEETGGEAGIDAVLETDAIDAEAAVVGETTCVGDNYSIAVADKGWIWLTLEASGRAAHGSRPMNGENAIDYLYSVIDSCRESVSSLELEYGEAVERIVAESHEYYGSCPCGAGTHVEELFAHPTVNLGQLDGGNTVNSVPQTATAELDVRVTPGASTEDVLEHIRSCIDAREHVSIREVSWTEGTYVDPSAPIVEAVTDAAEGVLPERPLGRCATGGSDAKKLREAGVPAVECAVGSDTAHGVDEYVTVEDLERTAAWYERIPSVFAGWAV
ncbi:Acetylornithine deacetylase/Succinyl-diaminopimelate desuccinylase or related deacylase [Halapricum desulfuricans]|uniref:Acetylornithine deacetylase/Succinyl-diaminopimelate desuccinylase or related deacylase n=2 Tax=Halapricum desulfuricans TaxID=2841257 RepID=A0A897MXB3_9EURY|nr:Acetylornithine deacetylase/Succinyl-diaminopimelate desuccinylase or related deacylase [Halapricum desulfuricans]